MFATAAFVAPTVAFAVPADAAATVEDAAADAEGAGPSDSMAARVAERPRVLVLSPTCNDVDEATSDVITQSIVQAMADHPEVEVLSSADLAALAALESTKQAVGCEDVSCLAEIAGAMGAQYVVFGSISYVDELYVANLSLFDADQAKPIQRGRMQGTRVQELIKDAAPLADELLSPLNLGAPPRVRAAGPAGGPNVLLLTTGIATASVGGLLAVGGIGSLVGGLALQQDATAGKDLKNLAEILIPVGAVASAVGVLGAAAGAGVAVFSTLE
jgi:hypothetical protein